MSRSKKFTEYRLGYVDKFGDMSECDHWDTAANAEGHALPLVEGSTAWAVLRVKGTLYLKEGRLADDPDGWERDTDSEDVIAYGGNLDDLRKGGWIT